MKEMIKKAWAKIVLFLRDANELWVIPIAIGLAVVSIPLFHWLDPQAGAYDLGRLHVVPMSIVVGASFFGLAWIFTLLNFPSIRRFLSSKQFEVEFDKLRPCQKIIVSLSVPFFFVVVLLLAAMAI